MDFYKRLGQRLADARKMANISQREAERRLRSIRGDIPPDFDISGINGTLIAGWERGERRIPVEDLSTLAGIYEISVQELIPGVPTKLEILEYAYRTVLSDKEYVFGHRLVDKKRSLSPDAKLFIVKRYEEDTSKILLPEDFDIW